MRRVTRRQKIEPVISLINIVFLILIFFMVTGTLTQYDDQGIQFVRSSQLECCTEPNALVISRDGILSFEGKTVSSPIDYLKAIEGKETSARLMPDRDLPAKDLLQIVQQLRSAGAGRVVILTETVAT